MTPKISNSFGPAKLFYSQKSPMNIRLLIALAVVAVSCAPYRQIATTKLQEGMTVSQVNAVLQKKKDKVVAERQFPQGKLAVYQYAYYEPWMGTAQDRYYLYFMNDTLIRYAPPEEWQEGAAKAIAKRYGK